jgi:hypothetical protein
LPYSPVIQHFQCISLYCLQIQMQCISRPFTPCHSLFLSHFPVVSSYRSQFNFLRQLCILP